MKKTLFGPKGVRLELDRSQVFEEDPGQGTPALVYYKEGCSTYWCACGEGYIDGGRKGEIKLPESVLNWLYEQDAELTEFLYK